MEFTTNYQLKKSGYDDPASIIDFMENFDTIDSVMKSVSDAVVVKADHTVYVTNPDLDLLLEDKMYICAGTMKNAPVSNTYCFIRVCDTASTSKLLQVCYVPTANNDVRTFTRIVTVGSTGVSLGWTWRELATTKHVEETVGILQSMIGKNTFRSKSIAKAMSNSLTTLIVNTFEDVEVELNKAKGSTAAAIENYYDATHQVFNKTDANEIYIYTATKVVTNSNASAWAIADWTNVDGGSVELAISRTSGTSYNVLNADTVTDISAQGTGVVLDLRIKLTGKLILKNVAWGCKS